MTADTAYIQRLSEGFIAEPQSVPAARHAIEDVCDVLGSGVHARVRLLVSELVTNALSHRSRSSSGKSLRMRVWTSPTSLRVAVADRDRESSLPAEPSPGELADEGWGLFLTSHLADRWGVRREHGTEVWFEIDTPGRS